MSESYLATFRWPRSDASNVIVTGTFDSWSCTHHLAKTPAGTFEGQVHIPWGEKVSYKYVVDGRWTTTDDQPTELDPMGNLNNVYRAPARPAPAPTPAPESAPEPVTGSEVMREDVRKSTVGAVNGFIETAKQAAASMVEGLAPGTVETPLPTPAVETSPPEPEATPEPQPSEPAPAASEAEPEPAPAEAEPEPAPAEVTSEAVLPSEPVPVAPIVPVPVLPLSTESPTDATSTPLADVSETKPLETTIVEGSTTAETAIVPAPIADAPAPEEKPSTHVPAPVNGTSEEKVATNGVAPAEDKTAAAVNGTTPTEESKPATPTKNGTIKDKSGTVNGKKMRFPSFSSRHSRTRSSVDSNGTSELGEKEDVKEANGKDTVTGRFASTQRQKRRTSLFGKLKDVFAHPKNEAPV
ncbi:hypothetical protein C8Q80DRAFT_1156524 [Daedaleopsis nitida]|nr:hypothetical protein C8Q80DRAFT_1156524 [Daedaleopsis nitida]